MVTCKHTAWCDARTITEDFWHPHSTCATCVPSGRLHEPTTGTSMFHTIVIGSFMKIILGTHYTLSFVCNNNPVGSFLFVLCQVHNIQIVCTSYLFLCVSLNRAVFYPMSAEVVLQKTIYYAPQHMSDHFTLVLA